MSEVKEFRPRLDNRELQFLIYILRGYAKVLQDEVDRLDHLPYEVKKLAQECWNTGDRELLKLFRSKKALLPGRWSRMVELNRQATVCKDLARRFEAMINGGKPHPMLFSTFCLRELFGTKNG